MNSRVYALRSIARFVTSTDDHSVSEACCSLAWYSVVSKSTTYHEAADQGHWSRSVAIARWQEVDAPLKRKLNVKCLNFLPVHQMNFEYWSINERVINSACRSINWFLLPPGKGRMRVICRDLPSPQCASGWSGCKQYALFGGRIIRAKQTYS